MWRVCYETATGRIIEIQSGGETEAHLQTLINNAVESGWSPAIITCVFMTDEEYETAKSNDPIFQAQVQAVEQSKQIIKDAKVGMQILPNWASWTPQEADNWMRTQIAAITTLPQAKAFLELALPNLAKAICYLRDYIQIIK